MKHASEKLLEAMVASQSPELISVLYDSYSKALNVEREADFNLAMSQCQSEMPAVAKDAHNPNTRSKFARLESVIQAIKPIYTKHGFSLMFDSAPSKIEHHVRIACTVLHSSGHFRVYFYDSPIDDTGIKGNKNKTETHGRGSAVSYARRYLTLMIFNIAIAEEDNDGNGQPVKGITADQKAIINKMISDTGTNKNAFLKWANVQALENMSFAKANEAINYLKQKQNNNK